MVVNTNIQLFLNIYTFSPQVFRLSPSIRSDGSSRFGKNSKYGYFPSAALMWRVSGERFMQNISVISDLKLRLSYGSTGNNNIGNYEHYALVSYPSHIFGGQAVGGMAPNNLENSVLTWEKQRSANFAIDASFLKNRINLTAEYYVARNHQLLYNVNIPMISGFTRALQNIGEVENKGWDFTLKTVNLNGKVNWSTDFNISTFKNKVLKLGPEGDPIINTMHITQIGSPVGMFYGHKTDGVFKSQAELDAGPIWGNGAAASHVGDIRFKDLNGDGVITAEGDKTIIGSPYPDFYGGMTNTVSYKNFQLSVAIQFNYGNQVGYTQDYKMYTRAKYKQFKSKEVWPFWRSEEDPGNGIAPRPHNNPTGGVREKSDRYLDDGSFLKVSNINLSYTFPRQIVQNLHLSSLRLYTSVNNAFLFTKFKDSNPEVSNNSSALQPGMFDYNYPLAISLLFGINVTF